MATYLKQKVGIGETRWRRNEKGRNGGWEVWCLRSIPSSLGRAVRGTLDVAMVESPSRTSIRRELGNPWWPGHIRWSTQILRMQWAMEAVWRASPSVRSELTTQDLHWLLDLRSQYVVDWEGIVPRSGTGAEPARWSWTPPYPSVPEQLV